MGRLTPRCSRSRSRSLSFPFSASPFSAWVMLPAGQSGARRKPLPRGAERRRARPWRRAEAGGPAPGAAPQAGTAGARRPLSGHGASPCPGPPRIGSARRDSGCPGLRAEGASSGKRRARRAPPPLRTEAGPSKPPQLGCWLVLAGLEGG